MNATIETLPAAQNPTHLVELAITKGTDVSQLEKLLELQERWEAQQARKAFFAAKARFQSICPAITKDQAVAYGNTKYEHASLSHIADSIREPLQQCDLAYDWQYKNTEHGLQVTCVLSHIDGHSESNPLTAPPDDSGSKNTIQQYGSTATYLQRYTLVGILGLSSVDQDDDGQSTGGMNVERLREHNDTLRQCFNSVYCIKQGIKDGDTSIVAEAYAELTNEERTALWMAPSKGGIFTTQERDYMRSDAFNAAMKQHAKGQQ